jgi:hypothetical protein
MSLRQQNDLVLLGRHSSAGHDCTRWERQAPRTQQQLTIGQTLNGKVAQLLE